MTYRVKSKAQRGDTIIEVLLAMAVVGMVLGSSFGIANRSLGIGRSAQERTTALKIAESQVELMKSATRTDVEDQTADFCMTGSVINQAGPDSLECTDIDGEGGPGLYTIAISKITPGGSTAYAVDVSWIRLGASGSAADIRDNLTLYYRLGAL